MCLPFGKLHFEEKKNDWKCKMHDSSNSTKVCIIGSNLILKLNNITSIMLLLIFETSIKVQERRKRLDCLVQ